MARRKKHNLKTIAPDGAPAGLRLVWAEAGSLSPNPRNWRRHPEPQMRALKAVLADVGWAGVLLYNERTGRLIDGHARQQAVDPGTPVPVLVGSWTEQQERTILATLDPLAAMAEVDADALRSLLADAGGVKMPGADELAAMMEKLAEGSDAVTERRSDEETKRGSDEEKVASSFLVIVTCKDETEQQRVFNLLRGAGVEPELRTLY